MDVFLASTGAIYSSNGHKNYFGSPDVAAALQRVQKRFPGHIVVDGDDDWHASKAARPEAWSACLVKPVALFHSGTSGMSKSGWVIRSEDLVPLAKWHAETFGGRLADHGLRVHPLMLRGA